MYTFNCIYKCVYTQKYKVKHLYSLSLSLYSPLSSLSTPSLFLPPPPLSPQYGEHIRIIVRKS